MKNSLLQKTLILFFLVFTYAFSYAQDEFMIYGVIQSFDNSVEGTRLKVEVVEDYKTIIDQKLEANGKYRLDLPYGKTYIISFTKPGYTPMFFDAKLNTPEGTPQCCYRPMEISFHMFKPDGEHDNLFKKTFHTIEYEKKHKGFNYDLDIDYMVQQRIVNSEIFKQKQAAVKEGTQVRNDSVLSEKKYLALINQGTSYYNSQQFYTARKLFLEAKKIKPQRMYPQYKLEDIRTELERFETKANLLGVNVDSIIQKELALAEIQEDAKAYPAYVPLTKAQIEEIFRRDVEKQILASSETPEEANRTLAMMNEFFKEEFSPVQIAQKPAVKTPDVETETEEPIQRVVDITSPEPVVITKPTTVEVPEPKIEIKPEPVVEVKPEPVVENKPEPVIVQPEPVVAVKPEPIAVVEPKPVVEVKPEPVVTNNPTPVTTTKPEPKPVAVTPAPKPTVVTPKPTTTPVPVVVDFKTYQDSLKQIYTQERTVEISQNSYKKTTRVFINNGQFVEVYAKVEHSWGATYYYLEEYPSGLQNIGYSAFMNKTKLYELDEKEIINK